MTDSTPIPLDEFAAALDRLDRTDLASFVGELEAVTTDAVDVDPPFVTVGSGDERTELLVVPDDSDVPADVAADSDVPTANSDVPAADSDANTADVDALVIAAETAPVDVDVDIRTPTDLRRRLLYAMSPETGNEICDSFLGVPARSPEYDGQIIGAAPSGSVERDGSDSDGRNVPSPPPGTTARSSPPDTTARSSPSGATAPATASETPVDTDPPESMPGASGPESGSDGRRERSSEPDRFGRRIVAIAVLALLVLAAGAGATQLGGGSVDGPAGSLLGADDPAGSAPDVELADSGVEGDPATNTPASTTRETAVGSDGDGTDGPSAGNDTMTGIGLQPGGRNVGLTPTCSRSSLHVVQIQMNALKYNDAATNEGIRTVRRFATPRNRRAVRTAGSFVRLFETPTYAPMMSYDSAEYAPIRIGDRLARVDVVTRENGSVTGRYEFRLRKLNASDPAGPSSRSAVGPYDGCWMTDAVRAVESFE